MADMARTSKIPMGGSAICSSKVWPATVTTPPTGTTVNTMSAGTTERYGASLKTKLSACSGSRSSLKNSLMPSASDCRMPHGPARSGPMRLCMSEIALRSNQIIIVTAPMQTAKEMTTLMRTISSTAQFTPAKYRGSPLLARRWRALTATPS